MATVVGLSARYANFLVHPLLPGSGVCQVCRGPAKAGYPACWLCNEAARLLGTGEADAVVPVSLALKGEQYANERTTGNHAQSAAAALKAGGAGSVAIVVLGRHLNIDYGNTADHVEQARLRRFSWDACPLRPWHHS